MKVFLLALLISSSVIADDSLFPLHCGKYAIIAPAKITTVDNSYFQFAITLKPNSLSKTILQLNWKAPEKFLFPPEAWVQGEIKLSQVTGGNTMKGEFITTPKNLGTNKEKLFEEVVELKGTEKCTP
jgi:hypothetical protein